MRIGAGRAEYYSPASGFIFTAFGLEGEHTILEWILPPDFAHHGYRRGKQSLAAFAVTHISCNLLGANVVSDVGAFMQTVGAAWLMLSLNAGPMYVALTQTASALPYFVLALPAMERLETLSTVASSF